MPAATLLVHAALLARLAAPYPFAVGERLEYEAWLGYFPVGTASAVVARTTRERGTDAFVFTAVGEGGPPGLRARYEMTSWVQSSRLASLRFHRKLTQGSKVDEERFQIVPDSGRYRQEGVPQDWVAPRDALDELAYLYYLRTIPLEVGKSFTMSRYFKSGYNPVRCGWLAGSRWRCTTAAPCPVSRSSSPPGARPSACSSPTMPAACRCS